MRIVFMGTPEFAVPTLDCLLKNSLNVVAVITAPDRPAGRGQQLQQSAVKKYALGHNLPVLQPEKLKDEQFIAELKSLKADLQIVVAFRMLPEVVWNMPPLGTYNLHASLLPEYRGAAPINWAIINGETQTGVTTFKLKHEIDAGNVLFQQPVAISESATAGELHDQLMEVGAGLMLKTVQAIQESVEKHTELNFIKQNESNITHAPKLFKDAMKIHWHQDVQSIYNLVRGLSPYPAAYTVLKNEEGTEQTIKLFDVDYERNGHQHTNGSLNTDNKTFLKIYGGHGNIDVKDLQLQGKKRMPIADFLKGFRFRSGDVFI